MSTGTSTTTSKTSTSGLTFEEMSESLTGLDELAVTKHMGMDVYTDAERRPVWLIRSLVFVHQLRGGKTAPDAKTAALEMTVGALNTYFEADPVELDPDDPETESGEDGTPPA